MKSTPQRQYRHYGFLPLFRIHTIAWPQPASLASIRREIITPYDLSGYSLSENRTHKFFSSESFTGKAGHILQFLPPQHKKKK